MSKYIIEVGDAYAEHICSKGDMLCLPVRINEFENNWMNTNIPLTPYTEPDTEKVREEAYEQGLSDAWEAARKILQMHDLAVFGLGHDGVFESPLNEGQQMTPQEAIEKLKAYEQEQEAIQVGDEVILDGRKYVVLVVDEDGIPEKLLEPDGYTLTLTTDVKLPKTGRHFPEIAAVLEKMRGEKDG